MKTKKFIIYYHFLFTLTLYAEIPMTQPFEIITSSLNMRLFIETSIKGKSDKDSSIDIERLHFLSTLVLNDNGPPDIGAALKTALPNSTISPLDNHSLRISDHSLNQMQKDLLQTKVEVSEFTGKTSDLLKTTFPQGNVILSGVSIGEDLGKLFKIDIQFKNFSFSGSAQNFFDAIATQYGEACGYKATFTSDKKIQLYFWGRSKNF